MIGKIGDPVRFTLTYGIYTAEVVGDVLEPAQNAPITQDIAFEKLSKLGNTSFELTELKGHWEDGAYMTISKLNQLRREAVEILEALI